MARRGALKANLLVAAQRAMPEHGTSVRVNQIVSGAFELRQDSMTLARNLVALEDAYGYRMMAKHPTLGYESAVELIVDYARLATGHPLLLEK